MAGYSKIYTSQTDYLYDLAKSQKYFSEEQYAKQTQQATGDDYLAFVATYEKNLPQSFDQGEFDKLNDDDKFAYMLWKADKNTTSETYKQNEVYFNQKFEQIKNEEIYNSLSDFEKTINTFGGWIGSLLVGAYGTIEGLIDLGGLAVGAKDFVAKDITGYTAAQNALNDWRQAYTFENKQQWVGVVNDVFGAIGQMAPMLVTGGASGVAKGIGTAAYYLSMAGSTAESAVKANPNIDYGSLLGYTALMTGLEAGTEWLSGKVFGEGLIGLKGLNTKAITGGMFGTLLHNMGTEAVEEAVSEIFGGLLEYWIVTQDRQSLPTADKVLYAALIGGLTGGFMAGGRIVLTPRMSVTQSGELKYTRELTAEEKKTSKKLGLRKSWALQSLLQQSTEALSSVDAITKLQAKYGELSLEQIRTQHAEEYDNALAADVETKEKQAKSFLALAKLMNTIGVENFKESVDLLNIAAEDAERMVDNYINRRSEGNKKATDVFNAYFPDRSFTPSTIPSNQNQALSESLRKAFPNLKIVFGKFGDKNGDPVRAINGAETYLFLDEDFVNQKGYKQALTEAIRYQLADQLMLELSALDANEVNDLVKLFTDTDVPYSELTREQKLSIAQILCFDPVNSRKLFNHNNKTHRKIFKYITDQAEYVKNFGRQTEANKIRYHDLLSIRNSYLRDIALTIGNMHDVETVAKEYGLSAEEVKTQIIDEMQTTDANDTIKLTEIKQVKSAIQQREAYNELYNARANVEESFDFDRLYDKDYYSTEFVNNITQNEPNFERALQTYLEQKYKVFFDDKASFTVAMEQTLGMNDVNMLAEILLTAEYLNTKPSWTDKRKQVIDKLYLLKHTGADKSKLEGDSIIVTDDQIKGTGKLKFFEGDIYDRNNIIGAERRRVADKGSEGQVDRVVSRSRQYIRKQIEDLIINQQAENTLDEYQKDLINATKQAYGLDLEFYSGPIKQINVGEKNKTLGFVVDGTNKVYVRDDASVTLEQIVLTVRHEVTHKLIETNKERYEQALNDLQNNIGDEFDYWAGIYARDENYGINYKSIDEEVVVGYLTGWLVADNTLDQISITATIEQFYKGLESVLWTDEIWSISRRTEKITMSQQTSNETKNIKSSSNATTPKQIADAITSIVANSPMAYSESKGFEGAEMEYTKVAQSMIDENFGLFRKVNQGNYQQIRDNIAKTDAPYTQQALIIFDRALFTYAEDSSRFDDATQEKIKNQARQTQTISAQWQGLQSRRLADKTSLTEIKNKFAEDGYDISVSNETVTNYVPEMKNKEKFIKQIDDDIAKIESQIDDAKDSVEKAALNKELKDATEKRMVIDKGTNEEIMDWVITNEDIVNRASKIQKEIFEQMVDKAEKAAETPGKKAITILVDEKTGLPKPFPKATQWIEKNVKRLKSFRMWAMLTSPVSWVRNWIGNAGMSVLDSATNQLEKWMTARLPQIDVTKLEQQAKELNSKKTLTDTEKTKLAEINAQIQQAYDFKFVETTASKELKQQIAQEYESVFQQILNGEDISKYEGSAEKAGAIARAEREITRKSENANFVQKVWAACQSMTDWGLNTGWFGDNAVVLNSLVKNFANMVESNKTYLIKSLTTEYGKDGRGMSAERKALVEKALNTKNSMDIVNAMSKADVELFMDSCKQRTFEQYFKNSNWLSKWASNLSQKHPIAASLTSLVLPFPKVAANIMTMAYKYSPLGFISALRQWSVVKQMDATGYEGVRDSFARAKLTRTTAQATVGTVMCIAGLILASLGFIDIDDDDYLGPALHVGDLRISLSNLAPSMTTFSVGAAMMWAWKNDQSAALKALDVLYDNTLLGNIENVFRYGDPTKYIENLSINYVSQYVPAMLKLFAKFTTNQAMIDKSGSYFEKLGKTFVSGIPFAADLLPKKINPYTGEFLTNTGSQDVFFNFMEAISPLDFKTTTKSKTQKEAERLGTESSGLTGKFKVNDNEYDIDKVTYSKYRATYIQNTFDNIMNGKQKVTVEDENGKRITTTYDKLTDKQKKNVLSRLYTEATNITKIKWWTDQGNKYVVTDRDLYNEYRKQFKNIVYKKTWTKSKFVES